MPSNHQSVYIKQISPSISLEESQHITESNLQSLQVCLVQQKEQQVLQLKKQPKKYNQQNVFKKSSKNSDRKSTQSKTQQSLLTKTQETINNKKQQFSKDKNVQTFSKSLKVFKKDILNQTLNKNKSIRRNINATQNQFIKISSILQDEKRFKKSPKMKPANKDSTQTSIQIKSLI